MSRRDKASFNVLYAAKWGEDGQLLWRHTEENQRWDFFFTLLGGDKSGESMLLRHGEASGGCAWTFRTLDSVQVYCRPGGVRIDFKGALLGSFALLSESMRFLEERQIIGQTAHCYRADLGSRRAGEMCLTDEGVPLSIDVAVGVDGPVSLRATALVPESPPEDVLQLPWTSADATVSVDELRLPPLPDLQEYLGEKSATPN